MSTADGVIEHFLGTDPIAGTEGLQELCALGDAGEEALFSRDIEFPKTVQVRRRWLRYIATREASIVGRLVARMQAADHHSYATVYLFAGLRENRRALDAIYRQLATGFQHGEPTSALFNNYEPAVYSFMAWGYAGGSSSTLWHFVNKSSFAWEKLKIFAFRASCLAVARMSASDCWAIEQLITHEWDNADSDLVTISDSSGDTISPAAVDSGELAMQANDTFLSWRRGEVADEILRSWSQHPHWRVREFGAQILASFGFQRTVTPVIEWLRREPVQKVRQSLLHVLERSETSTGANALIEHFYSSSREGQPYLAKAACRASDKLGAVKALKEVSDVAGFASSEALVSLARLGHRHEQLTEMLDSHDYYRRLNAALALAYLSDKSAFKRLLAMQREASKPLERIYLAAALAMLGKTNGATELNAELVAAGGAKDFENRVDLFFLHHYLQSAALDGLAAGGAQSRLNAWRAEMEPLDPIPQPVVLKPEAVARQSSEARWPRTGEHSKPEAAVANPLNVFISYSHKDERMRAKLGQHLASLVDEGLIRIWHDREIEAGADWGGEINNEIGSADIILLLVSASFLDSRYCRKELLRALEQRSAGKSLPVPIILRDCDWISVFNREEYKTQALPRDNRAVAGGRWPNQDVAFAAIAKELRKIIERMRR